MIWNLLGEKLASALHDCVLIVVLGSSELLGASHRATLPGSMESMFITEHTSWVQLWSDFFEPISSGCCVVVSIYFMFNLYLG